MNFLLYILGIVLCVLFFLNIDTAAKLLLKITGAFAVLFIYNSLAAQFSFVQVGINLITATTLAVLNLPGGILLLLLSAIF